MAEIEPTDEDGRHVPPATDAAAVAVSETVGEARVARARIVAAFDTHGAELRRFILGVTRAPETAEDVMQATLAKALEHAHGTRPETLKGWLFRVAFHEAMLIRRRQRIGEAATRRLADLGRAAQESPAATVLREEDAAAVRRALQALPEEQRSVVVARVYDDKTFAQIAQDAGLPLGTVLTRMRLALDKLRRALRFDREDD